VRQLGLRPLGLLLAVGAAACAVPTRVDVRGPDFQGVTATRLRGNVLPTPPTGIGAIELNAERLERPEEPFEYALLVEVRAEGLRVQNGESLEVVLGRDTVRLTRDSTTTFWARVDPTVREQARYPAPDSLLMRLASAPDVVVAVRGAGWWERRRLSEENRAVLSRWAQVYVRPDSVAPPLPEAGVSDSAQGGRPPQ